MAARPASDDRPAGARPAVVAADAAFSHLVADRVRLVPGIEPYQPGQFCLRELPPLRAVLGGLTGMALLVVEATPTWTQTAGPAWAPALTPSSPSR
jgi:hypothetical protein